MAARPFHKEPPSWPGSCTCLQLPRTSSVFIEPPVVCLPVKIFATASVCILQSSTCRSLGTTTPTPWCMPTSGVGGRWEGFAAGLGECHYSISCILGMRCVEATLYGPYELSLLSSPNRNAILCVWLHLPSPRRVNIGSTVPSTPTPGASAGGGAGAAATGSGVSTPSAWSRSSSPGSAPSSSVSSPLASPLASPPPQLPKRSPLSAGELLLVVLLGFVLWATIRTSTNAPC